MKKRLYQIIFGAFFVALLTINGNVQAEEKVVYAASYHENTVEVRVEFEEWMVNETFWHLSGINFPIEREKEEKLGFEAWMVDAGRWVKAVPAYFNQEDEKSLKIESWMISMIHWN